jgi:hypothetical protein
VTELGHLYVFGMGDGGRLGLGQRDYETRYEPVLVESLLHEKVASVSCGSSVTIAVTEINRAMVGNRGQKVRSMQGGRVYMAGSGNTLGTQYDEFTPLRDMEGIPVKQVSAGYQHVALVSTEGVMFCLGRNNNVCCGSSPQANFLEHPVPVSCLYKESENIAVGCHAYQSSTYDGREASTAVNGNTDGNGLKNVTATQQDPQAWWEVDLGKFAIIDEIRVWNRTDEPFDQMQPRDLYTARLFPCWCMIGAEPFKKEIHLNAVKENIREAVAKVKFTENMRMNSWRCPANTQGRYIRIQLEGFNFLHLAEVQVFGNWGINKGVGRVSFVAAGRDCTVAVIRPNPDPRDVETVYKRAVYSDSGNADILRQLENYALEYDKYGRGETLQSEKCKICRGNTECEICGLNREYGGEIERMPAGIGGRRPRLQEIDDYLINDSRPQLVLPYVPRIERPTAWEVWKDKWRRRLMRVGILRGGIHVTRPTITPQGYDENSRIISGLLSAPPTSSDGRRTAISHEEPALSPLRGAPDEKSLMSATHADDASSVVSKSTRKSAKSKGASTFVSGEGSSAGIDLLEDLEDAGSVGNGSLLSSTQYSAGDVAESGHTIKHPFPKSIKENLDASEAIIAKKKERRKREIEEEKQAIKEATANFKPKTRREQLNAEKAAKAARPPTAAPPGGISEN